jgi:molecular chaperone GrpE
MREQSPLKLTIYQSSISEEAKNNEAIKSVIEGIDLIAQSVVSTFEKIGIKKIDSLNKKFDHNLHQAMMEIENDDLEPGTIVQVKVSILWMI